MIMRGDVYFVDFGSYDGSKQGGVRPALVVSNDKANTYSPVITVVPMTSQVGKKRSLPTHVFIPKNMGTGLNKDSMVLAEQVESLDKSRLLDFKGHIDDPSVMRQVTEALKIQLGAVD